MTTKPPKTSPWQRLLLVFALIPLTACATKLPPNEERIGALHYKRLEWQEQVRFSTGEEIVVRRGERRRLVSGGEWRPGWLFDTAWIEADLPKVGRVRWEGSLSPLVLDVTPTGEWYLLGVVATNKGTRDYGLAEHKRYVAFRLSNSAWQRVPFRHFPEYFKPNLLADTTELIWEKGAHKRTSPNVTLVTYDMKRRVDSNPQLDRALRIIDRALGE